MPGTESGDRDGAAEDSDGEAFPAGPRAGWLGCYYCGSPVAAAIALISSRSRVNTSRSVPIASQTAVSCSNAAAW
jgi:hypothetical protein